MEEKNRGSLIVLSGFSGAGKGTIVHELIGRSSQYALSISMTTRSPRPGEEDGREYFFVTRERFEEEIKKGGLLEHAEFVGNYYGTPRFYVEQKLAEGKDVLLEIDTQGGLQIRKIFHEAILVFVITPSVAELERRLRGRNSESEEVISKRLMQAEKEVEVISSYDFCIVNNEVEESADELENIIRASHLSASRTEERIDSLRSEFADRFKG